MKKNFVIIILVLIVLCLSGFFIFDKYIIKESEKNEIKDNDKKTESIVTDLLNDKIIQTFVSLDGIDYEINEFVVPYVQVTLPYVNRSSVAAKQINDKIQADFSNEINIIRNNITVQEGYKGPHYTIIDYSYAVKNNVLFIYIYAGYYAYEASGGGFGISYYYDIENDKVLNTDDVLKILGKSQEDLKQKLSNVFESTIDVDFLNDLDKNISIIPVAGKILIRSNELYHFDFLELWY